MDFIYRAAKTKLYGSLVFGLLLVHQQLKVMAGIQVNANHTKNRWKIENILKFTPDNSLKCRMVIMNWAKTIYPLQLVPIPPTSQEMT